MARYPDENTWWNTVRDGVIETCASVGITFPEQYDWDAFKWWARTASGIGEGLPAHESRTIHLRELEQGLGIDPLPVDGGAPVVGYPDEGPYEYSKSWWNDQRDAIIARYAAADRPFPSYFNFGLFKWWARIAYDIERDLSPEASKRKHLRELADALGIIPPVLPNRNRLRGVLRQDGWQTFDESGPRIPVACHFMEGFSAWVRRPGDVRKQAEVIAQYYGIVRNLDVLGYWDSNRPDRSDGNWVAWLGREVTPIPFRTNGGRLLAATPNYWEHKRDYVLMLHSLGLKIMDDRGDMNAWTRDQQLQHMRRNGQFYASLGDVGHEVLAGLWGINEAWQNGAGGNIQLLRDMITAFKEGAGWWPSVRGLSAPGGEGYDPELPESFKAWSVDPASSVTSHGNRGHLEHIIEHYFGYGYDSTIRRFNKKVWNTEPVGGGHGVSVGQVNDPEILCGIHAAMMATGQQPTFMSGNGVFWNGPIEDMPGFREVARLTEWIPHDAAAFTQVIHAGNLFHGQRILAAVDPTRFDCAIHPDGRFTAVLHTVGDVAQPLPCERACREFSVIDMVNGVVEREGPLQSGERVTHAGQARLVIGRLA